jgi:hypothetical protein
VGPDPTPTAGEIRLTLTYCALCFNLGRRTSRRGLDD